MGKQNYYNIQGLLRNQLDEAPEDFDESEYWDDEFDADLLRDARYYPVDAEKLREVGEITVDKPNDCWSTTIDGVETSGKFSAGAFYFYQFSFEVSDIKPFKRFLECYPHF